MNKEMESEFVPKLRFKEFDNNFVWKKKSLNEVFIFKQGVQSPVENQSLFQKEGWVRFIRIVDLTQKNEPARYIKNPGDENILSEDDLFMVRYGTPGIVGYNLKGVIANNLFRIMPKLKDGISNKFYSYVLNNLRPEILGISGSSTMPALNFSTLGKISVPFTDIIEQQKIADCLSSLDDLITAETERLDVLKEHKRGLMQQLFVAEGEQVPKLRFPEFKHSGEWEMEVVGEVYDFKITNSFSRDNLNYIGGEVKNIHYGDIHTKFKTLFDITNEKVPYVNSHIFLNKIKRENYCIEGDIVFADASEDVNDIGKSIELINLNGEKLIAGLHTFLARQKNKKLVLGFAGYLFKSVWVRQQIQRESQGTKVLSISTKRLSDVKICYPKSDSEQRKIVECLSSLDKNITTQTYKVEDLKLHKKGLMQGLFPHNN